ncbi:MAG: aldehyde dehydrogenase family protein [Pseudomonadota bacterium]
MSDSNLQALFDAQQAAYLNDPFPSAKVRIDRIDRLIDLLVTNEKALANATVEDFGQRSVDVSRLQEILPSITALKYAKKHVKKWMRQEARKSDFPFNLVMGKSSIQHIPLGVIGNVSPWNYPVFLSMGPMSGIFAAGNRAMIKPSELTPHASELMQSLVTKQFDPTEFTIVTGGVEVASEFCGLPFDHLLFTGSTSVGSIVMQNAAKNLTPMTLELGGKSPVIVADDANIKDLAVKLAFAKTMNFGQVCLSPDYVLVSEHLKQPLIDEIKKAILQLFPEQHNSPDITYMIAERHCTRLKNMVKEAEANGNNIIRLFDKPYTIKDPRYMEPTIIEVTGDPGSVMDEEIFGPLLPIISIEGLQKKLAFVASKNKPLTIYYFGKDKGDMLQVSQQVAAGNMVINDFYLNLAQQDLPFGGVGKSGMGQYQGHHGFKNFSHAKAIFKASKIDMTKMVRPPYDEKFEKIVSMQIKK